MTDEAVVNGEYVTFSHIKGRKQIAITIEFPEEKALEVFNILGTPIAQISKPVAVALLVDQSIPVTPSSGIAEVASKTVTKQTVSNSTPLENEKQTSDNRKTTIEKSEGEKLLARSHILCKDLEFLSYIRIALNYSGVTTDDAAHCIYMECNIKSRKELVTDKEAQEKFKTLVQQFNDWKFENTYKDNLNR